MTAAGTCAPEPLGSIGDNPSSNTAPEAQALVEWLASFSGTPQWDVCRYETVNCAGEPCPGAPACGQYMVPWSANDEGCLHSCVAAADCESVTSCGRCAAASLGCVVAQSGQHHRVPPASGLLMVWFLPMDRLQVEFISQGRLAQRRLNDPTNLDDNRIPEGGTPGYVTYHARAAWRASDQMTARLSLDNLTDALVLEHGSGFYLQGRSATGSIDVAY